MFGGYCGLLAGCCDTRCFTCHVFTDEFRFDSLIPLQSDSMARNLIICENASMLKKDAEHQPACAVGQVSMQTSSNAQL